MRPQTTTVCIVQSQTGWRILLIYEDGEEWLSAAKFETEEDAEKAALMWSLENAVAEGRPS